MRFLCVLCLSAVTFAQTQGEEPSKALDRLLALYKSQPSDWRVCHQIGLSYMRLEQLDRAREFFQKTLALNASFLPARKNLATTLWFLNRKREAEREFRTVTRASPDDPVPHLYVGLAEYERKRFLEAMEQFEKAGDLALKNPEVLPVVAETYDRAGQPEKAYAAYKKAIELDPSAEDGYIALAGFAVDHQNNEFALKVTSQGLEKMPGSLRLLVLRGLIQALLGKQEDAERTLLDASRSDPKSSLPLLAVGVSQLERGRYQDAAASFRRAADIAPGDFRARYLYATALRRAGDPDRREELIAALRKAEALNPKDARPPRYARPGVDGSRAARGGRDRAGEIAKDRPGESDGAVSVGPPLPRSRQEGTVPENASGVRRSEVQEERGGGRGGADPADCEGAVRLSPKFATTTPRRSWLGSSGALKFSA